MSSERWRRSDRPRRTGWNGPRPEKEDFVMKTLKILVFMNLKAKWRRQWILIQRRHLSKNCHKGVNYVSHVPKVLASAISNFDPGLTRDFCPITPINIMISTLNPNISPKLPNFWLKTKWKYHKFLWKNTDHIKWLSYPALGWLWKL